MSGDVCRGKRAPQEVDLAFFQTGDCGIRQSYRSRLQNVVHGPKATDGRSSEYLIAPPWRPELVLEPSRDAGRGIPLREYEARGELPSADGNARPWRERPAFGRIDHEDAPPGTVQTCEDRVHRIQRISRCHALLRGAPLQRVVHAVRRHAESAIKAAIDRR